MFVAPWRIFVNPTIEAIFFGIDFLPVNGQKVNPSLTVTRYFQSELLGYLNRPTDNNAWCRSKMPCALEELDTVVRQLEGGQMSALQAIEALLSVELSFRETRRIKVALGTSRLMPPKTLESFDFAFQQPCCSLDRERIYALAGLNFVARAEIVHLLGPPGTGKSHLACALGVAAVKAGDNSVYRCTLADLVDSLSLAHRAGQLANKLRFYTRASLLIVDEIGSACRCPKKAPICSFSWSVPATKKAP